MAKLDLSDTMDALAAAVPSTLTGRRYAYPAESVEPPAVIVGYPEDIDFDTTFGRGSDTAVFPLWYVVGRVTSKTARDALSAAISGAVEVKAGIEGDAPLHTVVQTARVTTCRPEFVAIAGVSYLAARFDVEVVS